MSDRHLHQYSPGRIAKLSMIFAVLCLLSSITTVPARGQLGLEIKTLPRNVNGQCSSVEERERVRNEIHQLVKDSLHSYTCKDTPGWRQIAFINMTDTNYSCPTGLNLTSSSNRTLCGRSHLNSECSSTTFDVGGLPYSQVCGRIRGYQFGATSAFGLDSGTSDEGIDGLYVEGAWKSWRS